MLKQLALDPNDKVKASTLIIVHYSCGHKYRDTLQDFIFAKVVHNIAFKSHSPTCYVSKS